MNLRQLRAHFENPSAEFRPQPVWSLNSLLTRRRLTQMLEQFKQQGMGGVFVLPRWGLITGFLDEDWFEMWGHAMRECKRLGMECQIYDEFLCPSGHAGGHVPAEAPHTAARLLQAVTHTQPQRNVEDVAAAFALDAKGRHPRRVPPEAIRTASAAQPVMALHLVPTPARSLAAGFPLPDLTRHDATATFLRVGYEPYARRFGREFGRTVRYVFTDEPGLVQGKEGFLWSELLSREFWKDHGYRMEDRLAALCFGGKGATAVRFDYFSTLNRLFCANFARQISEWCEAHGLLFTGHYYENKWPDPIDTPSTMALMRWMHAPGNDYLAFQCFPDDLAANRLYRFNLRELSSVANQLGRAKTMVESSGAGGYEISFALFKSAEDLLLAHGVNVMNPHLSHVSLAGARQYEWPQTISDHSSWFPFYRRHADHVARTAAALSQGRERNRVLLLQPTSTLWMHWSHPAFNPGQPPTAPRLEQVAEKHYATFLALTDRQIDFDLGDETILAELGRAGGRKLTVGERSYELVVLSAATENWTDTTLKLVTRYLAGGGRIVQTGAPPTHVNGRPDRGPARLRARYGRQWEIVKDADALAARVSALIPPRLAGRDGAPLPQGLIWRRAEMEDGDCLWFLCNPWNRRVDLEVRLAGAQLAELDTSSGKMRVRPARREGASLVMPLTLHARGHALWLARAKPARGLPPAAAPWQGRAVPLSGPAIETTRENQLLLDFCDIETGEVRLKDVTTFAADQANWRVQGFEENPWMLGHTQFKRTIVDREVDEDSAFSVRYSFDVDASCPAAQRAALALAVERPWLYNVRVNGRTVDSARAKPWFDEHMRRLPIGRLVKTGRNTVELAAKRFHMLCEIKPVYVLGPFALKSAAKGFRIVPPRSLTLGDWTAQGLPFYPHGLRYAWSFRLDRPASALRMSLGRWEGSVARVTMDGREAGTILHPPYSLDLDGPVAQGRHTLAIEVIGNMRNMLGPHFSESKAGPWAWQWASVASTPPGKAYTLRGSGLLETPTLEAPVEMAPRSGRKHG